MLDAMGLCQKVIEQLTKSVNAGNMPLISDAEDFLGKATLWRKLKIALVWRAR